MSICFCILFRSIESIFSRCNSLVFRKVRIVTEAQALDIFRRTGALLEGHFILRSGLRSRRYIQCALALQQMPDVESLAEGLFDKLTQIEAPTILAPAMGGLVIGQEVARQRKSRFLFAEKVNDALELRRGFHISPGEKVIIVEDVITKGGRVTEAIEIVRQYQGEVAAVAVLVNRSSNVDFGVPLINLIKLSVDVFDPENLPADLQALPATKPGS